VRKEFRRRVKAISIELPASDCDMKVVWSLHFSKSQGVRFSGQSLMVASNTREERAVLC
jgi:hypothetical protein